MLYFLIRPLVRIALRLFLRELHIVGIENIPKDKAVILAANHPTAFIEPCIMACFQERSMFFLARGNLFGHWFYDFLLKQVHILPVYRLRDKGYAYVKHNFSTFEACYQALGKQKMVMILAEGTTIHEKRLRPLVKGTGRIAFGAMEYNETLKDVYIVPVGVNYTHADRFQSDLYVNIGKPISTKKMIEVGEGNKNKGILKLTQELHKRLLDIVIHINDEKDDKGIEVLLEMIRPNTTRPVFSSVSHSAQQFIREKKIVDIFNDLPVTEKEKLWCHSRKYTALLKPARIDENVFKGPPPFYEKILLLIFAPLYFLSVLLNGLPFALAQHIADHRVKYREFYSSVLLAVTIGAYLLYLLLVTGLAVLAMGNEWFFCLLAMPLLMVFGLYYRQYWGDHRNFRRWQNCSEGQKDEILRERQIIRKTNKNIFHILNETDHILNEGKKLD